MFSGIIHVRVEIGGVVKFDPTLSLIQYEYVWQK